MSPKRMTLFLKETTLPIIKEQTNKHHHQKINEEDFWLG
jgi:hypothetical protein